MKRTWEVRYSCTNYVHWSVLLPQVALHLLGSESPLFEPILEEVVQKAGFDNDAKLRSLFGIEYEANLHNE